MGYVTNAQGQTNWETSPGNTVLKDSVFDPGSKNYNAQVANSNGKISLGDLNSANANGLSSSYNGTNGSGNMAASIRSASDNAMGIQSLPGNPNQPNVLDTSNYNPSQPNSLTNYSTTPTADTAAQIKAASDAATAKTAADFAALKSTYENQLTATTNPYKTAQANIPGQTAVANNQASSTGMVNAQHIRNALSQMGLLQSGESASQQLANDIGTASNINANDLAGQQLDAGYNDKIAMATAQNAMDYNNAVTHASEFAQTMGLSQAQLAQTISQQGVDNAYRDKAFAQAADQFAQQMGLSRQQYASGLNQWAQTFAQTQAQDTFNNGINQAGVTGYYNGIYYKNGVATDNPSSSPSTGNVITQTPSGGTTYVTGGGNTGNKTTTLSNGNKRVYDNGPNGWTEYDPNGNAVGAGTS